MQSTRDAKHYMNVDILSYGVQLPYWKMELLTDTMFKPGAVIMLVDLFYNNQVQYADYLKSMSTKPDMSFSMFDNLPAPKFDVIETLMSLLRA